MTARTLVEALAEEVSGVTLASVPHAVRARARQAVLDTLGAIVVGTRSGVSRSVRAALRQIDGGSQATVIGTADRLSLPGAALATGTAAHAWEVDDFGGCGHSGAVVLPAVLAAGELAGTDGRGLLEAVVAGYEAAARITAAAGGFRAQTDQGWHVPGTCGSFGAAAATARVLQLDPERTADALSIAGSFTGGLWAFVYDGADTKRIHAGKAAANGLVAAFMAEQGATGPRQILEARWGGMFSTYMGDGGDPAAITDGLGSNYHILKSGIKPYAACRGNHFAIEAVLSIMAEEGISSEHVTRVTLYVPEETSRQLGKREVGNALDAQLSMPFCVAVALAKGDAALEHFLPEALHDQAVRDAMERVVLVTDPTMSSDERPRVEVQIAGGACRSVQQKEALGGPGRPLTDQQVRDKFRRLARMVLTEAQVSSLEDAIDRLEGLDNAASTLAELAKTES